MMHILVAAQLGRYKITGRLLFNPSGSAFEHCPSDRLTADSSVFINAPRKQFYVKTITRYLALFMHFHNQNNQKEKAPRSFDRGLLH